MSEDVSGVHDKHFSNIVHKYKTKTSYKLQFISSHMHLWNHVKNMVLEVAAVILQPFSL